MALVFTVFVFLDQSASAQVVANQAATIPAPVVDVATQSQNITKFQARHQALAQSFMQLLAQGASQDQIAAWRQQNEAAIKQEVSSAQALSALQVSRPIAYVTEIDIPEGVDSTTSAFLKQRANLYNLWVQSRNLQLQNPVALADADAQFREQNSDAIQAQVQLAIQIAPAPSALPAPPPLDIPPNALASLQAFMTLRDKLIREEIQIRNQNLSLSASAQQTALEQWRKQNAQLFTQLQLLERNVGQGQ